MCVKLEEEIWTTRHMFLGERACEDKRKNQSSAAKETGVRANQYSPQFYGGFLGF